MVARGRSPSLFPVLETGLHRGMRLVTTGVADASSCSRSSRPGSIAAGCGRTTLTRSWGLFPVLETGLHRGLQPILRQNIMVGAVPGPRDRAPSRRGRRAHAEPPIERLFPVLETGLHRGDELGTATGLAGLDCSRSSRPGSIAAWSTCSRRAADREAVPGPRDRAPSRRFGLGWVSFDTVTVPGPRDRAPSRQVGGVQGAVEEADCSRSSRPGSIAAGSGRSPERARRASVPGPRDRAPSRRVNSSSTAGGPTCSRSSRPGSIAAGCPRARRDRCPGAVPGPRDRAPSRQDALEHGGIGVQLFPVLETGLHRGMTLAAHPLLLSGSCSRSSRPGSIAAGSRTRSRRPTCSGCSRSSRPGSIAAWSTCSRRAADREAVPGPRDRAPSRRGPRRRQQGAGRRCSRSSRPGSIAAACLSAWSVGMRRRCSRSSRPGSIAASGMGS